MFSGTPVKMQLQFLVLCLIYAFQCTVFNAIPFLYYRSDLECKINGKWQICQEQDICNNGYQYQFTNTNGMQSISMEYGLICNQRLTESTLISIGFIGQFSAFFIAIFTEVPKNQKTKVLFLSILIEGVILYSTALIKGYIYWIMVVIFVWNFVYSYLYSQIFAYINDMFTDSIKDNAINILNIFWTSCALLYIIYAQFDGSWINYVAYFSGVTVFTFSILFFALQSPPAEVDPIIEPLRKLTMNELASDKQIAKEQQRNFIEDLIQKFRTLKNNKKYLINSLIFICAWTTFQLSYSTPFIAFNNLGGDIQKNVLISVIVDVASSFASFFILCQIDGFKALNYNIIIIAFLQTISYFFAYNNFIVQLIVILATKLSTRLGLTTCLAVLPFVLPYMFNQLTFNIANVIAILLSALLPYYSYYMQLYQLSIFCGIGVLHFLLLLLVQGFKKLEDENAEIKTSRISKSFIKRSSFGPVRKNSDTLIETMLRKSSMIVPQAGLMLLDKQSATIEKIYNLQAKQSELETINEI
ncbi:hypothetical protein ABPG72_006793 [Tetrahymena utriculariae]